MDLAAEIDPSDPLYAIGWRTVLKAPSPVNRYRWLTGQGIGTYLFSFGIYDGWTAPTFPYGVRVTQRRATLM